MTIREIAKKAGVSVSTVSRVINKKDDVSPETRKRVNEIIEKYNYQPNVFAKNISQKKSRHIGVVITHDIDYIFKNQYYDEVFRGIIKAAKEKEYYIILLCCEDMKEAVDIAVQKRIDGMILISPSYEHKKYLEELTRIEFPIVTIGKAAFVENLYQICTNNYYGATLAMKHLINLGHRNIAFINGPNFLPSSNERYRAYRDSMLDIGVNDLSALAREGENSIESGAAIGEELVSTIKDLSAIFVASDFMAIGTMNAIRNMGLRVPEDISVVGFDGIPISEQYRPSLTTVDQFVEKKGIMSVEILIDIINGESEKWPYNTDLDTVLRVRESTGKVSENRKTS